MTGGQVVPFGDQALLAILGNEVDEALNAWVHTLVTAVLRERDAGVPWGRPVPAYASLLVPYDIHRLSLAAARGRLEALVQLAAETTPTMSPNLSVTELPVRYGGAFGSDLEEVARRVGLDEAHVVELHASVTYRVFMLGFVPGFAYLGPLPAALELPRRSEPRPRVPVGSVAIAGRQTGVYPSATPGGWHLIGTTEATLWDPTALRPSLLQAGQLVRFVPQLD